MSDLVQNCDDAVLLAESNGCSVYQFRNETGEGVMTVYEVFPGVTLSYNDFHMQYYDSVFRTEKEVFCIDHCREGRLEYTAKDNAYSYVEARDLKLDRRLTHTGQFVLPLSHYHGITIAFDLAEAAQSVSGAIKGFAVDLCGLQKKFCPGIYPVVLRSLESADHIFSELYAVPQKIRQMYFKIKVLELLLYLEALELPQDSEEKPYFYKSQVEKVRAIRWFMEEHVEETYTQEELSKRFGISLTMMKKCFCNMYGTTMGAWLTSYRMNQAAVLLKSGQSLSVAEIAGRVGYDSPSKFAAAFRKVMKKSPTEYRNCRLPDGGIL